jgi:hypothetical protein
MTQIDFNEKLSLNNQTVTAEMDGDLVMLDIEAGEYYGITEVARFLWDCLQNEPHSLSKLVDLVCSAYDVSQETCTKDVTSFVVELKERGLLL